MRKRNKTYPDVLELWGITWTKHGDVWLGPAVTDPEDPTLALSVEYQRIVRRDCSGLQTAAPKPANKGHFRLTFRANKRRLGLTITANEPTFWANSLQTVF